MQSSVFHWISPFSVQIYGLGMLCQFLSFILPWATPHQPLTHKDLLTPLNIVGSQLMHTFDPLGSQLSRFLGPGAAAPTTFLQAYQGLRTMPYWRLFLAGLSLFCVGALSQAFYIYGALSCLIGLVVSAMALLFARQPILSVGFSVASFGTLCILYDHWMAV